MPNLRERKHFCQHEILPDSNLKWNMEGCHPPCWKNNQNMSPLSPRHPSTVPSRSLIATCCPGPDPDTILPRPGPTNDYWWFKKMIIQNYYILTENIYFNPRSFSSLKGTVSSGQLHAVVTHVTLPNQSNLCVGLNIKLDQAKVTRVETWNKWLELYVCMICPWKPDIFSPFSGIL